MLTRPSRQPRRGQGNRSGEAPHSSASPRRILNLLEELLWCPPPAVLKHQEPDGSVRVKVLFNCKPELSVWAGGNPNLVARVAAASAQGFITGCVKALTVRLRTIDEQLRLVVEGLLSSHGSICADADEVGTVVSKKWFLPDLLCNISVVDVFASAPGSSGDGVTRLTILQRALAESYLLQVTEASPQMEASVQLRPAQELVGAAAVKTLQDAKAKALMARDGEVPLSWLMRTKLVEVELDRIGLGRGKLALETLRLGLATSDIYALESGGTSVRERSSDFRMPEADADTDVRAPLQHRRSKGLKELRMLLLFYFKLFNIQHNRLLLSCAERATCASGWRYPPNFSIEDLCALPRVGRILKSYSPVEISTLLECALRVPAEEHFDTTSLPCSTSHADVLTSLSQQMPLRICEIDPAKLELTYTAALRFIMSRRRGDQAAIRPIKAPVEGATKPPDALPPHALCVLSYSVSSDLSHDQSPKTERVLESIFSGVLEPTVMFWEVREKMIVRQLTVYAADIVCIQGLQSIGFAERCSEETPAWFSCDEEPRSNHLVSLYRELSKDGYGVAFAPTMRLPGSDVLCFGNAVFWKRSRWALISSRGLYDTAVTVELASRLCKWHILVCSTKPAAAFSVEWGDCINVDELTQTLVGVSRAISVRCAAGGIQPIWCGDFGCEPTVVLHALSQGAQDTSMEERASLVMPSGREWRSASVSVLHKEPTWTALSGGAEGRTVDAIFHDATLCAEAVLSGCSAAPCLEDFLREGFPSDHLLQLAIFTLPAGHRIGKDIEHHPIGGATRVSRVLGPHEKQHSNQTKDIKNRKKHTLSTQ